MGHPLLMCAPLLGIQSSPLAHAHTDVELNHLPWSDKVHHMLVGFDAQLRIRSEHLLSLCLLSRKLCTWSGFKVQYKANSIIQPGLQKTYLRKWRVKSFITTGQICKGVRCICLTFRLSEGVMNRPSQVLPDNQTKPRATSCGSPDWLYVSVSSLLQ